jgi:PAS domain-containing protein
MPPPTDPFRPFVKIEGLPIPKETSRDWQKTVDLLAQILELAAALIVRVLPAGKIEVVVSSQTRGNPYRPGMRSALGADFFSATVATGVNELLVPNLLAEPGRFPGVDSGAGLVSYLGMPLYWPTGQVFGAICVLDRQEKNFEGVCRRLLGQSQDLVRLGLQALYNDHVRIQNKEELDRLHLELEQTVEKVEHRVQARTQELARANEALRISEARFRTLIDHAPEAMLVMEMDSMKIIDINAVAEKLYGWSREELLRVGPADVSPR